MATREGYRLTIDLATQQVTTPEGTAYHFEIDPFRKRLFVSRVGCDRPDTSARAANRGVRTTARTQAPWLFQDVK